MRVGLLFRLDAVLGIVTGWGCPVLCPGLRELALGWSFHFVSGAQPEGGSSPGRRTGSVTAVHLWK